jgi:hypothetical protein
MENTKVTENTLYLKKTESSIIDKKVSSHLLDNNQRENNTTAKS